MNIFIKVLKKSAAGHILLFETNASIYKRKKPRKKRGFKMSLLILLMKQLLIF
jgi:hypothetical protein